jgi:alpha-mannosidase
MTWEGELYLELHNGTYTSMSEHKFYNRFMEILLRDVELLHYLSDLLGNKSEFTHE